MLRLELYRLITKRCEMRKSFCSDGSLEAQGGYADVIDSFAFVGRESDHEYKCAIRSFLTFI